HTIHPQHTSTLFPYTTLFRSPEGKIDLQGGVVRFPDTATGMRVNAGEVRPLRVDPAWMENEASLTRQLGKIELKTATPEAEAFKDRKSTRLNSSHLVISYAVF